MKFESVPQERVPKPITNAKVWPMVYAAILDLTPGNALRLETTGITNGRNATKALRALADKNGDILRMSREPDGKAFYFWIEPNNDGKAGVQ